VTAHRSQAWWREILAEQTTHLPAWQLRLVVDQLPVHDERLPGYVAAYEAAILREAAEAWRDDPCGCRHLLNGEGIQVCSAHAAAGAARARVGVATAG
jgi:hypothetical protein